MTPEQAAAAFRRMAGELEQPNDLIKRVLMQVEAAAKKRTPVRTGNLRRSITNKVETAQRGRVGTNVKYAPYVHEGTRYTKGRPFLRQGLEDSRGAIEQLLERYGQSLVDNF